MGGNFSHKYDTSYGTLVTTQVINQATNKSICERLFFCCCADADYKLEHSERRLSEPERYVIFSRLSNKQRVFDAIVQSSEKSVEETETNSVGKAQGNEIRDCRTADKQDVTTKTSSIDIPGMHKSKKRQLYRDRDDDTWSVWSPSVVVNPEMWHAEREREDNIIKTVTGRVHLPEICISLQDDSAEAHSSPMLTKSSTPSPVVRKSSRSQSNQEWQHTEDDIDHLVAIHSKRLSLSNLGNRSDSMASVYSGAGEGRYGTVAVKGQVEVGLQYNYKAGALEICVKQCRDLAAVDTKRNRSDPYVKVYLLPDKSKSGKRKTKVKKHTLNPVFDENLKFLMSLSGLETRTLWLTVWHSDMFGRNDFLGEVMMTLENKVFDDPTPVWYNLQERTEPFDDLSFKGDILVGLKFVPPDMTVHKKGKRSRGSLHVLVKEAKTLAAVKSNGMSDPFCKSYLLPDKGRHSKQKTSVIRRTVNPVWNHVFVYDDVTLQELAERCLELTIWDHDRLASNEFIGGVRFSLGTGKTYGKSVDWMDATSKESALWKNMLERPNFWVEACIGLRSTLEHRTS